MIQFDHYAVGAAIRAQRKKKKLSQEVLSNFACIARSQLAMIENGSRKANFETIWKIANALEIPPRKLVFLIEKEAEQRVSASSEGIQTANANDMN